jgi:repressor of nif and glnA expression
MTSRAIASSNQWKESTGAVVVVGRIIAHADFAGFLTVVDMVTATGNMVTDTVHTGFVTPDDSASTGNADFLIFGGGFATLVGN